MSNAQSWAETFAPIEQRNREIVFQNTWGHLAPVKNVSYKFKILFSVSAYCSGTRTIIDTWFDKDLDSSPWLYDAINEEINTYDIPREEAGVYLITGTFRNYRFYGSPIKVYSI